MIRIDRSLVAKPGTLANVSTHLDAIELEVQEYLSAVAQGVKKEDLPKIKHKNSVYSADDVKSALLELQHDKCAYCESKHQHVDFGDVEHFRPKGGYFDPDRPNLKVPGYYWLAYEWGNLLLSCARCNQDAKSNHFPLASDGKRATTPACVLSEEKALLVDPMSEEPADFIGFRGGVAYAVDDNERGATTLRVLNLNRRPLREMRWGVIAQLELMDRHRRLVDETIASGNRSQSIMQDRVQTREFIDATKEDSSQYAGVARAFWAERL